LACMQLGYSSRDVRAYHCCGCGDKGHLRFWRDDLKNSKRSCRSRRLRCKDCSVKSLEITCNACGLKKHVNQFEQTQLSGSEAQDTNCVCLECTASGYSNRDVRGYPCVGCGIKGHRLFSNAAIQTYNRGGLQSNLICSHCMRRSREIRRQLLQSGSWRCTCRKIGWICVHRPANEKCELFPRHAGEKRWPGKNKKVSIDDLALLERCTKTMRKETLG
jgi:hypothetical protein